MSKAALAAFLALVAAASIVVGLETRKSASASASADPAPSTRSVSLTGAERHEWVLLSRQIDDAQAAFVERCRVAHSLDERTVLDVSRGVLVAPVTSAQ